MFVPHETARILLTQNQIYLLEVSLLVHQPFFDILLFLAQPLSSFFDSVQNGHDDGLPEAQMNRNSLE